MNVLFGLNDYNSDDFNSFVYDDENYDFCLTLEEEQVVLHDTCDRYVPLDFDGAIQLYNALQNLIPQIAALKKARDIVDSLGETVVQR